MEKQSDRQLWMSSGTMLDALDDIVHVFIRGDDAIVFYDACLTFVCPKMASRVAVFRFKLTACLSSFGYQ